MVALVDVSDSSAVGDDVAFEAPIFAKMLNEQGGIGAGGLAVQAVVRAHDGFGFAFENRRTKRRQIGFFHVVARGVNIHRMTRGFRAAVNGEVLRRGDRFEIVRIVALQTSDKRHAETRREIRVFAVGFLAASPARIAKDVDVRRPDGEAAVPVRRTVRMNICGIFGAKLRADHVSDIVHKRLVKRRSHTDGLRKHGGESGARDAVKSFIPPVISRNAKPGNRGSGVRELVDFFFKRHAGNQVGGTLFDRNSGIQVGCVRGRLLSG